MSSKRYFGTSRDIRYEEIEGVDPSLLSLDVFVPEGGENLPVIFWLHGGAWTFGDKAPTEKGNLFNRRGMVFVTANYRLSPSARFPVQAVDAAAAFAWTKEHIRNFRGDPSRVYAMGHSAGAHLAALIAVDESYLMPHLLNLKDIRGVAPVDTQVYDLKFMTEQAGGKIWEGYEQVFGTTAAQWDLASPITHIQPGKGIPPMIVPYSRGVVEAADPQRAAQNKRFVEELVKAGVRAESLPATHKTYAQINLDFGQPGDTVTEKVLEFFGLK